MRWQNFSTQCGQQWELVLHLLQGVLYGCRTNGMMDIHKSISLCQSIQQHCSLFLLIRSDWTCTFRIQDVFENAVQRVVEMEHKTEEKRTPGPLKICSRVGSKIGYAITCPRRICYPELGNIAIYLIWWMNSHINCNSVHMQSLWKSRWSWGRASILGPWTLIWSAWNINSSCWAHCRSLDALTSSLPN